jgi:hypothetical protein
LWTGQIWNRLKCQCYKNPVKSAKHPIFSLSIPATGNSSIPWRSTCVGNFAYRRSASPPVAKQVRSLRKALSYH